MERSHLKHSLAVGELEISHLDYIRQSFDDIHDAECYEYKRHIVSKGKRRDGAAEKQRAGISHEHLGRVEVIDKKAHKSAEESRGKYAERHVFISPKEADCRKEETYRYARSACKSVYAVGNVDCIDRADDYKCGKNKIYHFWDIDLNIPKRNVELCRNIAHLAQQQHKNERRNKLEQELCLCAQAEILLLAQLFPIVEESYGAENKCKQQDEYMRKISAAH